MPVQLSVRSLQFAVFAIGSFVAWQQLQRLWLAAASRAWHTVEGEVLVARLLEFNDDRNGDTFMPEVRYRYTVRGVTHEGHRIGYSALPTTDYSESLALIRDIRAGQAVTVHYDPADPRRAVLVPGYDAGNVAAVGVTLLGFGAAFFWLGCFFRS